MRVVSSAITRFAAALFRRPRVRCDRSGLCSRSDGSSRGASNCSTPHGGTPNRSACGRAYHQPTRCARDSTALDTVAQHAFLERDDWRETMRDLNDWFAVQTLYNPQQVKQYQARLASGIEKMSAEDLQKFMIDMREKLEILRSDEATAAAEYLAKAQGVASPGLCRAVAREAARPVIDDARPGFVAIVGLVAQASLGTRNCSSRSTSRATSGLQTPQGAGQVASGRAAGGGPDRYDGHGRAAEQQRPVAQLLSHLGLGL